ncbi:choice-of-anchor M domain-containing protein [Saccharothrix sp. HUAS TT1]|uniref:choice-of-anchor M domain-containing protein n=1 Tax=unclassified Saccharothrix TaxID=2593673 RepID=UPI00345B8DD1
MQDPNVVRVGWNTEALTADQIDLGSVRWTLDAIGGDLSGSAAPGEHTVFQSGPVGEPLPRVFDTALPLPQQHPPAPGTHAHANWAFGAEGAYRITVEVAATLTDSDVFTIANGACAPSSTPPTTSTDTGPTTTAPVPTASPAAWARPSCSPPC